MPLFVRSITRAVPSSLHVAICEGVSRSERGGGGSEGSDRKVEGPLTMQQRWYWNANCGMILQEQYHRSRWVAQQAVQARCVAI